jgi:hypothetical protein
MHVKLSQLNKNINSGLLIAMKKFNVLNIAIENILFVVLNVMNFKFKPQVKLTQVMIMPFIYKSLGKS